VIKRFSVICMLLILTFIACSEEDNGIGNVDGIRPGPITDLMIMSSSPDVLIHYWNIAFSVPNIPKPSTVGTEEILWVDSLSFLAEHYFAIRSLDEAGNISYISNIAHGRPFGDSVLFMADTALDSVVREHVGINYEDSLLYSAVLVLDTLTGQNRQISNLEKIYYADNLTKLNLANNQIVTIDTLYRLRSLDSLVLSHNRISNIDSLSGLTSLQYLHLDSNQIGNIDALAGLINLTHLYLDSNQIDSIYPLVQNYGLDSGDYVSIRDNPISDTLYIDTLEARGVTVTR